MEGLSMFFGDLRRRSVFNFSTALAIHLFPSKACCPLLCLYIIATEYVGFVYATVKVC